MDPYHVWLNRDAHLAATRDYLPLMTNEQAMAVLGGAGLAEHVEAEFGFQAHINASAGRS
jgi:hypothetical protein